MMNTPLLNHDDKKTGLRGCSVRVLRALSGMTSLAFPLTVSRTSEDFEKEQELMEL